ncbi:MAG: DUF4099 domain-containing protein [Bacteroidetes bacterium]|nr:DUF4099 domain-containing protein [Bacteroidota bacterium]
MLFSKEELPLTQFKLLGVDLSDASQMPSQELALLLEGRGTNLLKCMPVLPGETKDLSLNARLKLVRDSKGKAILKFQPSPLKPENIFGLSPVQIRELKSDSGKPILAVGEGQFWVVFYDAQINQILGLNFDSLRAPIAINGQTLNEEQELRFKLGETISIKNLDGSEMVFRLDPFQLSGIIGRNLDSLDIWFQGSVMTVPYKGGILIDNPYLLEQGLGGLIVLEEAIRMQVLGTSPNRVLGLEHAFVEAKQEIVKSNPDYGGQIKLDEIAHILFKHLHKAEIPFENSLEDCIDTNGCPNADRLTDKWEGHEKIHWLIFSKDLDDHGQFSLQPAIGATIIGLLSPEGKNKLEMDFQKAQTTLDNDKGTLSTTDIQDKIMGLLLEQLGHQLNVYHKESAQKITESSFVQKQQSNISQ